MPSSYEVIETVLSVLGSLVEAEQKWMFINLNSSFQKSISVVASAASKLSEAKQKSEAKLLIVNKSEQKTMSEWNIAYPHVGVIRKWIGNMNFPDAQFVTFRHVPISWGIYFPGSNYLTFDDG